MVATLDSTRILDNNKALWISMMIIILSGCLAVYNTIYFSQSLSEVS